MNNISIIIFAIAFIITSVITKLFKSSSNGNSVKQEGKIIFENTSFFVEGLLCFLYIYLASKLPLRLAIPLWYLQIGMVILITIDFIRNTIKVISENIKYFKIGSEINILLVQLIKVIIISYLVYQYYLIFIR